MLAVALGLLASLAFACTATLVHRGVQDLDPFSGLVVDLFFNGLVLWLFVFTFHDLSELWAGANLIFAASGLIVPGLFRLVAFKGIERMGAAAATAVLNSAPLFAVLLAMVLLGRKARSREPSGGRGRRLRPGVPLVEGRIEILAPPGPVLSGGGSDVRRAP